MAAPKPAPVEAPRRSGETIGLRNIPWYEAPETERAAPTREARAIRGNLIETTTASSAPLQPEREKRPKVMVSITFDNNIFNAVKGFTGNLPTRKERENTTMKARGRISLDHLPLFLFTISFSIVEWSLT